jgi:hypothetical protein
MEYFGEKTDIACGNAGLQFLLSIDGGLRDLEAVYIKIPFAPQEEA